MKSHICALTIISILAHSGICYFTAGSSMGLTASPSKNGLCPDGYILAKDNYTSNLLCILATSINCSGYSDFIGCTSCQSGTTLVNNVKVSGITDKGNSFEVTLTACVSNILAYLVYIIIVAIILCVVCCVCCCKKRTPVITNQYVGQPQVDVQYNSIQNSSGNTFQQQPQMSYQPQYSAPVPAYSPNQQMGNPAYTAPQQMSNPNQGNFQQP